mgnify:CR=1 FL=1
MSLFRISGILHLVCSVQCAMYREVFSVWLAVYQGISTQSESSVINLNSLSTINLIIITVLHSVYTELNSANQHNLRHLCSI